MMYSSLFLIGLLSGISLFIISVKENLLIFRVVKKHGEIAGLKLCIVLALIQIIHSFVILYLINLAIFYIPKKFLFLYMIPILLCILYFSRKFWTNTLFHNKLRILLKDNMLPYRLNRLLARGFIDYKKFFLIFLTLSSFAATLTQINQFESYFIMFGLSLGTILSLLLYLSYLFITHHSFEERHLIIVQKFSSLVLLLLGLFIVYSSIIAIT